MGGRRLAWLDQAGGHVVMLDVLLLSSIPAQIYYQKPQEVVIPGDLIIVNRYIWGYTSTHPQSGGTPSVTVPTPTVGNNPLVNQNIFCKITRYGIIVCMSETRKYEVVLYDGVEAHYYPTSGVVMQHGDGTPKFLANFGGHVDFDGSAMIEKRWADTRASIIEGLSRAASEVGLNGIPQEMLAEIVKHRAIHATRENRDGTESAKFIFQVLGTMDDGHGRDRSHLEIKMSDEMAEYAIKKLIEASNG